MIRLRKSLVLLRILFCFCIFTPINIFAEIEKFESKYHLQAILENPTYKLSISDFEDNQKVVDYYPNVNSRIGGGVFFKEIAGLSYTFATPVDESELSRKGKTTFEDWRLNLNYKKFQFNFNYQKFEGFYIENTDKFVTGWNSEKDDFLQENHLKLKNISFDFLHVWDPEKFSLLSSIDQVERQKVSGGSWLWGLLAKRAEFTNPTPVIPLSLRSNFGSLQNLVSSKFSSITLSGGYGHTWVYENELFFTVLAKAGAGYDDKVYITTESAKALDGIGSKFDLTFGGGYNGKKHTFSSFLSSDSNSTVIDNLSVTNSTINFNLTYGYRL
jgi:hypothetical protein